MRMITKAKLIPAIIVAACFAAPAIAATERQETPRSDGSMIHWSLDVPDNRAGQVGLIVMMQGSGCQPTSMNQNLVFVRDVFSDLVALTVDKYGVDLTTYEVGDDEKSACPAEFYAKHTNSQRVEDYQNIISGLEGAEWWNGQLILIGGSEGGDVAAQVGALVQPDATILISTGGGFTFGKMVIAALTSEMEQFSVPHDQRPDFDEVFKRARANPESHEVAFGSSLRYWADAIDKRSVDSSLKIEGAILLVQGAQDMSTPLEDARAAVDEFIRAGRCNLTYWEMSGYDHGMINTDGNSKMPEVVQLARSWAQAQIDENRFSPCMKAGKKIELNKFSRSRR